LESKVCTVCGLEQSLERFALLGMKRYPSLRRHECKTCRSQRRRGEERRRREQMSPEQLAQYREQNRLRNKRYYGANTEKALAKARAWKKRNRPKLRLYANAYNAVYLQDPHARQLLRERIQRYTRRHPERRADLALRRVAQKKGSPITDKVMREIVYERDHGICHLCQEPVTRAEMSMDHLIPLADHGPHTLRNVALAHKRCNFRRGKGRIPAQLRLF
jgi:5-methylcytosine-specific restriction endonuclease McrA